MPVFISYSHKDAEIANKLGAHLVKARANVWIDTWELNAGDSIIERIQQAIGESSALLILLSKTSVESAWCKKELNSGLMRELDEGKMLVIPVLLDDCDIPLFLREKKYVDLRSDFNTGLREVIDAISTITNSDQARLDEDDGFLDWAEDWQYVNDNFNLRFTYIGSSDSLKMSFLTIINVECNDVATERYKMYEEAGLGRFGRQVIAEAMFDIGKSHDYRILLEDQFPKQFGGEVRDEMRGAAYTYSIETRKLGQDNGKDQLIDVSDYLVRTRDFLRSVCKDPTEEEKEKLLALAMAPWPSNVKKTPTSLIHATGIKGCNAKWPFDYSLDHKQVNCPVCLEVLKNSK